MSYVIAAYGLTVGLLLLYAVSLRRERARLREQLSRGGESNPG